MIKGQYNLQKLVIATSQYEYSRGNKYCLQSWLLHCYYLHRIPSFEQYYSNEDTSVVVIKPFKEANRNTFPVITLCFTSESSDGFYDNQYILSNTGLTGSQYRDIMLGNVKMPYSSGVDKLSFDMATIKLEQYLTKFKVYDSNYQTLLEWKRKDSFDRSNVTQNLPVDLYYRDPFAKCYYYHTGGYPNITLSEIEFYFSVSELQRIKKGKLYIYVHYKNQLLRTLRNDYKIESFHGINSFNNYIYLYLKTMSIMRTRKDRNEPCNEDLKDDDGEWMQHVVTLIGCFPPYWKNMYSRLKNFNECNTTQQLKNISGYLPLEGLKTMILKKYCRPCEEMRTVVLSARDQHNESAKLKIKLQLR